MSSMPFPCQMHCIMRGEILFVVGVANGTTLLINYFCKTTDLKRKTMGLGWPAATVVWLSETGMIKQLIRSRFCFYALAFGSGKPESKQLLC